MSDQHLEVKPEAKAKSKPAEAEALLRHIRLHHPELVELAEKGGAHPRPKDVRPLWQRWLGKGIGSIWVDPKSLHGPLLIDPNTKRLAEWTAGAIMLSNITDFVGNWAFWVRVMSAPIGGADLVMGTAFNLLILGGLNGFSGAATRSAEKGGIGRFKWAVLCFGVIPINMLQTLISATGPELLNNGSLLANQLAGNLFEEQVEQVKAMKSIAEEQPDHGHYFEAKKLCQKGKDQLATLPEGDPVRRVLYLETYGLFGKHPAVDLNGPMPRPDCPKAEWLKAKVFGPYETAAADLQAKRELRSQMGNDVEFLKAAYPAIARDNFTDDGMIKNGTQEVTYALISLTDKIMAGNWTGLGLSGVFFVFSALTSILSIVMMIVMAESRPARDSWNSEVQYTLERIWNDEYVQPLISYHEETGQALSEDPKEDNQ